MPGWLGWGLVVLAVVAADAWAKAYEQQTMSTVFARNRGWAVPVWAGVTAHLLLHEERK